MRKGRQRRREFALLCRVWGGRCQENTQSTKKIVKFSALDATNFSTCFIAILQRTMRLQTTRGLRKLLISRNNTMMVQSRIPNHPVNFISHISRRCFSSDTSTVDANSPPSPPLPHFSDLASAVEDVGEQDEHVELLIGDFEIGSASQDENNEFYNNDDLAISDIDSDTEVSVDASVDEDVAEIVEIGGEIEVAVAAATTITIPSPSPTPNTLCAKIEAHVSNNDVKLALSSYLQYLNSNELLKEHLKKFARLQPPPPPIPRHHTNKQQATHVKEQKKKIQLLKTFNYLHASLSDESKLFILQNINMLVFHNSFKFHHHQASEIIFSLFLDTVDSLNRANKASSMDIEIYRDVLYLFMLKRDLLRISKLTKHIKNRVNRSVNDPEGQRLKDMCYPFLIQFYLKDSNYEYCGHHAVPIFSALRKSERTANVYNRFLHYTNRITPLQSAGLLEEMVKSGHVPKFWLFQKVINAAVSNLSTTSMEQILEAVKISNSKNPDQLLRIDRGNLETFSSVAAAFGKKDLAIKAFKLHESFGYKPSDAMSENLTHLFAEKNMYEECINIMLSMEEEGMSPSDTLVKFIGKKLSYDVKSIDDVYYNLDMRRQGGMKVPVHALNAVLYGCYLKGETDRGEPRAKRASHNKNQLGSGFALRFASLRFADPQHNTTLTQSFAQRLQRLLSSKILEYSITL